MPEIVETGLPAIGQPFSWATRAGGTLYTAHGPVDGQGRIVDADIDVQTRLTFDNLRRAVQAAGATLTDVTQVLIYMKDGADMPAIDAIYREYFRAPYPNRSSIVVAGFVHPAMRIEIVAYAALPE